LDPFRVAPVSESGSTPTLPQWNQEKEFFKSSLPEYRTLHIFFFLFLFSDQAAKGAPVPFLSGWGTFPPFLFFPTKAQEVPPPSLQADQRTPPSFDQKAPLEEDDDFFPLFQARTESVPLRRGRGMERSLSPFFSVAIGRVDSLFLTGRG